MRSLSLFGRLGSECADAARFDIYAKALNIGAK